MNLLDENFPKDQLPRLKDWRIPFRQIGPDVARAGAKDSDIVPLLHLHRGVTFFTLDQDFFIRELCHPAYGLVWLDVRADDAAHYLRSFLKLHEFGTQARRMGLVARTHQEGVDFWRRHLAGLQRADWREK